MRGGREVASLRVMCECRAVIERHHHHAADPRLSVLLPVHDGERYLKSAIDSILAQTMPDFELLVLDDGSRDGSRVIAERAAEADPRVRVVSLAHRGVAHTLNHGIGIARAPLVARMDADDVALPERFRLQLEHLERHPEIAVLGGQVRLVDTVSRVRRRSSKQPPFPCSAKEIAEVSLYACVVCHPTVVMRTAVVRELGGYRPIIRHTEDYDLWLRVLEVAQIANLPDELLMYRRHDDTIQERHRRRQLIDGLAARASALGRRATGVDPIDGLSAIDEAALERLELPPDVRARWAAIGLLAVLRSEGDGTSISTWLEREARRCIGDGGDREAREALTRAYLLRTRHAVADGRYRVALEAARMALKTSRGTALKRIAQRAVQRLIA